MHPGLPMIGYPTTGNPILALGGGRIMMGGGRINTAMASSTGEGGPYNPVCFGHHGRW